jgi:hypothetical protein
MNHYLICPECKRDLFYDNECYKCCLDIAHFGGAKISVHHENYKRDSVSFFIIHSQIFCFLTENIVVHLYKCINDKLPPRIITIPFENDLQKDIDNCYQVYLDYKNMEIFQ